MTEQEVRVYARLHGWEFVRQNGLPLGGYWVNGDRSIAFYVKERGK